MFWLIALMTSTPLLILFLFLWFYLWAKKKHTYWRQRGIYSPRPIHWLYGHLFNCETATYSITHQNFADISESSVKQETPAIGVYIFHKPRLLLRDPNLIRRLISDNKFVSVSNSHFCIRSQNGVIENDVNNNLYSLKSAWRTHLRTVLEMSFSEERMHALVPLMLEGAKHLRCYLDKRVLSSGKLEIHVHGASRKFITDIMMSVLFGIDTNSFEEPDTEIYKHACGLYKISQPGRLLVLIRILFPRLRSLFGTCTTSTNFFRDLFWKSMNERKKTDRTRGDFMDMLLKLHTAQDDDFKFERDGKLFAYAMLLVTVGLEASARTMTLTLFEMARNRKIQRRVRREILEKIGTKPITYELISRMSYLESVVSETLRMYPSIPFLTRVAQQNYKIPKSDIVIEKGTVVYVSLRSLHLNPLTFPSPLKYDPDRFSKQNSWRIMEGTYLPFGGGTEKCIAGNRLALAQIKLGLIVVMRDYKISTNLNMRDRAERTSAILNQDYLMTLEKSPVIDDNQFIYTFNHRRLL